MIIFDLDGTLADCNHRKHLVMRPRGSKHVITDSIPHGNGCILTGDYILEDGKKWVPRWQEFFELCEYDLPIKPTIDILQELLFSDRQLVIWSGRCESVRDKTNQWLHKHLYKCFESKYWGNIDLRMRPIGDYTPDDQLKERWLDEELAQGCEIEFVFDDRPKVVKMWRRRRIFVFNCYQRDEEF